MRLEKLQDLLDDVSIQENGEKIRVRFGDLITDWICCDDPFLKRISPENLNEFFLAKHLEKEIEMKNVLDEGILFLNDGSYAKAIERFDRVICYDAGYSQALISKSRCLCTQGHFVKALRFFKKSGIHDDDYRRLLLRKSSEERDGFPKIKRNIYAGDEAASRGEFTGALDFYDRALADPSKFKSKILFRLLNKKAFVLIELSRFDEALDYFDESLGVHKSDLAYYGKGYCQYRLGLDCIESLDMARKIDKKHLLGKALILNDLKCHDKALACFDEFLDIHFTVDDDFRNAIGGKVTALEALNRDSSVERDILSSFNVN